MTPKTCFFLLFLHFFSISTIHAQARTRNGVWLLYSKATRINGIGLSVNSFPEDSTYFKTQVNGLNVQLSPTSFLVMGLSLARLLFDSKASSNQYEVDTVYRQLFVSSLRTNGINVSFVKIESETTNGVSVSIIDIENKVNGVSVAMIGRRIWQNGVAISALNQDQTFRGLQIGLFNSAKKLKGFQIGLWNTNQKRKLPFVNWAF